MSRLFNLCGVLSKVVLPFAGLETLNLCLLTWACGGLHTTGRRSLRLALRRGAGVARGVEGEAVGEGGLDAAGTSGVAGALVEGGSVAVAAGLEA